MIKLHSFQFLVVLIASHAPAKSVSNAYLDGTLLEPQDSATSAEMIVKDVRIIKKDVWLANLKIIFM